MPQDKISGKMANDEGRRIAKIIAENIGVILEKASNECLYKGKKSVIKSAKHGNANFGITNSMLQRIEQIILAKQDKQNESFKLYLVPVDDLKPFGRESRSKRNYGKVTDFRVSKAIGLGVKIGYLEI